MPLARGEGGEEERDEDDVLPDMTNGGTLEPALWYGGSDWLTKTTGGMGASSARMTTSDACASKARGVVRVSARVWPECGTSSPSRAPHRTSSASEQSDGHAPYGDVGAAEGLAVMVSARIDEVMI